MMRCGQLLPRLDHNIGTQEMLAVVLSLFTWMDLLDGVVVMICTDTGGEVLADLGHFATE